MMTRGDQMRAVEAFVCNLRGISIGELRGISKGKNELMARKVMWIILFDYFDCTYSLIARMYLRDHTTIFTGIRKGRSDKVVLEIIEAVKKYCDELAYIVQDSHTDGA